MIPLKFVLYLNNIIFLHFLHYIFIILLNKKDAIYIAPFLGFLSICRDIFISIPIAIRFTTSEEPP